MNPLDLRTVLISDIISTALCAIVMSSLWLQNRRRSPELGFWLADFVMQFAALLLIVLRGTVPDSVSVLFGIPLIHGGTLLLYIGLERFLGQTSSQRHNYILLLLFILVHAYFTFAQPSLQARNLNLSVGLLVFFSQCLWLLLHRVNAERRLSARMLSAILIADSLVSVARIWADVAVPLGNDLFKSGLYDTLAILIYQMLLIGLTLALFLMVNRRLSAELERDIAELKESEEKMQRLQVELRSLSLTDDLTGLSNRRGFMMLVEQELKIALRTKRGMFLLFSDLDDLKTINDTRGHSEGDAALLETANLLRETFRESDILARLGGDEFAVLAVETAEESVDILAARLQKNMAAHNACLNRSYPLSLSIGIARYDPDSPCPVEELLARADGLMYEEKRRKPPPYLSAES